MLKRVRKIEPGGLSHFLWEDERFRKELEMDVPLDCVYLNLGCGTDIRYGYINADKLKLKGVDILLDLDRPLPFKNNSVDTIRCDQVIAHIKYPLRLKKEADRILKVGGSVYFTPCTCNSEHIHNKGGEYKKVV